MVPPTVVMASKKDGDGRTSPPLAERSRQRDLVVSSRRSEIENVAHDCSNPALLSTLHEPTNLSGWQPKAPKRLGGFT